MNMIRARVIETQEVVLVDDEPIYFNHAKCYNMWHNSESGMVYHDYELEFIDKRLQKENDQT